MILFKNGVSEVFYFLRLPRVPKAEPHSTQRYVPIKPINHRKAQTGRNNPAVKRVSKQPHPPLNRCFSNSLFLSQTLQKYERRFIVIGIPSSLGKNTLPQRETVFKGSKKIVDKTVYKAYKPYIDDLTNSQFPAL